MAVVEGCADVMDDREEFRELFDAYAPRIYQYAVLRVGSPADAEEILQETMLAVWLGRDRIGALDSVGAWIYGIARNKTVDALRRTKRPGVELADVAVPSRTEAIELAVDAQNALRNLDDEERDLVLMVFFLGLTYEEVSQALEIPVGTVKSRMFHIRKRLRSKME